MSSGLYSQLGLAEETTWGTYVAPGRFLEFTEESMALDLARVDSEALRPGQVTVRSDAWCAGKGAASGDLTFEIGNKGFGLLLKHMLGTVTTTVDGAGKKHSATVGTLLGKGLSVQVGRPDITGAVQPFSYTGCKVASWELSQEVEAFAMLTLSLDAQTESVSQTIATVTAPAVTERFNWGNMGLTVGGVAVNVTAFTLSGEASLADDRFYVSNPLKGQQVENGKRTYSGSFTFEFSSMANYNLFRAGTLQAVVATWTATSTYDTAKPFKLVATMPAVRFDGSTPQTNGPDIIEQEIAFTCLDAGAGPITLDYFTSDAAP